MDCNHSDINLMLAIWFLFCPQGVLEGYNSTVFAYGQTGCGKSFTMQGVTDPASQRGIIPRAFEHIFEAVSVAEGTKYLVLASYLEIYNEDIRDLLGRDVKRKLDLKEHTDKGVYVQGKRIGRGLRLPCVCVVTIRRDTFLYVAYEGLWIISMTTPFWYLFERSEDCYFQPPFKLFSNWVPIGTDIIVTIISPQDLKRNGWRLIEDQI